jgi:hypothetical protein
LVLLGNANNVDGLSNIPRYTLTSLPMKYLDLLLRAPFKAKSIRNGVIEKIECRLVEWKMMYLSKGGRITLINSSLSNLLRYCLSLSSFLLVLPIV